VRSVELSADAKQDLARLEDFLFEKSPRAAVAALEAIRTAVKSLTEFPERGFPVGDGRRRQLVVFFGRDGYVVRYRVTPQIVFVTRIFHGRERRR
jgi:plasmid stabilization system protein ParE